MGNIKSVLRFLNRLSKTNDNRSLLLRIDGGRVHIRMIGCLTPWGKSREAGTKYESSCAHSETSITSKCPFS